MHILFNIAKKRIVLLLTAILTSMLGSLCKLAPLFAIYFLSVEILAGTLNPDIVQKIILWTMLAMILRWALLICANSFAHIAAYNILYDTRVEIANRLTLLPLGYITKLRSGDLKRVLQEDIEQLETFLGHTLLDISSSTAMLLGGGICLFILDPIMACAVFIPLPLALLFQAVLWKNAKPAGEEYTMAVGRMNSNIVEFIRAIPVIKSFGLDGASMQELKNSINSFQKVVANFCHAFIPVWVAYMVLTSSAIIFILPLGGWRLIQGSMDVATFIFFILIGIGIIQNLIEIINFSNQMGRLYASFARIKDIMQAPTLEAPIKDNIPQYFSLEFKDVSFSYNDKNNVLNKVNIICKEGTTTAIVGPSGAGKSTLAQLAVRFWDPQQGSISIGSVPLKDMHIETLNTFISTVFQDVFLFQDSIENNICVGSMGGNVSHDKIIEAAKAAQIHDFIMSLPAGYKTIIGERGARLSGGQKQRLAIARAILKKAPIIILDEATAYADPINEHKIHAAIQQLCANSTVFIIAHRLSSIRNADQIVVMNEGQVVDIGSHEILFKSCTLYKRLWSAWEETQKTDTINQTLENTEIKNKESLSYGH